MTTVVATVTPETAEASRLMIEHRISGLPVVDEVGTPVGIVTERDFLRTEKKGERPRWIDVLLDEARSRAVVRSLHASKVSDVMTHDPVAVHVESSIEDVLQIKEYNVRRVPVLYEGEVVGIISRTI